MEIEMEDIEFDQDKMNEMSIEVDKNLALVGYATECLKMLNKNATSGEAINRLQTLKYTGEHLNAHKFKRLNSESSVADYKIATENFISKAASAALSIVQKILDGVYKMFKALFDWIRRLFGGEDKESKRVSADIKKAYEGIKTEFAEAELQTKKLNLLHWGADVGNCTYTDDLFDFYSFKNQKVNYTDQIPFWNEDKNIYVAAIDLIADAYIEKCNDAIDEIMDVYNEAKDAVLKDEYYIEFLDSKAGTKKDMSPDDRFVQISKDLKKTGAIIIDPNSLDDDVRKLILSYDGAVTEASMNSYVIIRPTTGIYSTKHLSIGIFYEDTNIHNIDYDRIVSKELILSDKRMIDAEKKFVENYFDRNIEMLDEKIESGDETVKKLFDSNRERIEQITANLQGVSKDDTISSGIEKVKKKIDTLNDILKNMTFSPMIEHINNTIHITKNILLILMNGLINAMKCEVNANRNMIAYNLALGRYIRHKREYLNG